MYFLVLKLLHAIPPEWAHNLAVFFLKLKQRIFHRYLGRRVMRIPRIETPCGLECANRLGLAAGFDKNAESFPALASLGFGFLEVGTVTPLPQPGNPKPRLFREPNQTLVNRMGFNNCGLHQFREHLIRLRPLVAGIPIMANIGKGKETPLEKAIEDYQKGFQFLSGNVDGFVVNVSSPNTPSLVKLQSKSFIESIGAIAPTTVPVWMKFSPDLDDELIRELLFAVKEQQSIRGVVLTNTSRTLAEKRYPEGGGLSGTTLLPRSLHLVKMAREILGAQKTIVGVGGVSSLADFKKMREAGADLVEIYTAFIYQGPALVRKIASHAV